MDFVSFHTHTTYSYGDGYGTVEQHVNRVKELGMGALALSEHGNGNSHAALERFCNNAGIKPIFGVEAYFGPTGEKKTTRKTHLTIFAMNQEGYHNLNKIITQSWIDFHQFPTVSPTTLKKYNEGILVFSGCSDSLISCTLLGGKFLGPKREPKEDGTFDISPSDRSNTSRRLQWFLDVFGPDRFFLEVQRFPKLERTCALNETFAELGEKHGISLVATADVHYPRPTDNHMQAMLHAARWPSTKSDFQNDAAWEYQANLSYPESDDEIITDLVATGLTEAQAEKAVQQTKILSEACNVVLPKAAPLRFRTKHNRPADKELAVKILEGWNRRVSQRPDIAGRKQEYLERVKTELAVIVPKDFSDYFLTVADLIRWAKDNDITVGPGRGSAAGSVVCYLLGITEIDPLHPTFRRMIFERFIDPNREDMPDIDIDFDDSKRWMVPKRAVEVYGNENVANVANHISYKGKNTLKDVARAYSLGEKIFKPIAKRVPDRVETDDRLGTAIQDVLESYASDPEIISLVERFPRQLGQAMLLEGNQHSMGIHAGGFVIASEPIPNVCPIYTKESGQGRKRKQVKVIPYEKRDAEYLGMLKMDFLGLSTMGEIGLIRDWTGMNLDTLYSLFYRADEELHERILECFRSDDCTGIFQYEGNTTRQVVKDVRPENFDELAACNALSRPGPLYGGMTKEYIAVKNGEKEWTRIHPTGFDRHVEWTYGQIVYQEQIMWILRDLAGFDNKRVLKVRKIIGKKLGESSIAALWEEFREGCAGNGVSEEDAERVFRAIRSAAGYAFNTSHAYSYMLIAWWSMFFKIHDTPEFFASALAKNGDGADDISRRTALLQDARGHGISVIDFDPDVMGVSWAPAHPELQTSTGGPAIVPGYSQIPGIAEATAADIVDWKATFNRKIKWWHLINVKGVGEKTIMDMVEFASKEDPLGIDITEKQLELFRAQSSRGEFEKHGLPAHDWFYKASDIPREDGRCAFVGFVGDFLFKDEIESIRTKTGESVEEIKARLDRPDETKKATLFAYDESGELSLRVSRWRYQNLASRIESIEAKHHVVVAWGRIFKDRPGAIQVEDLWVLNPE